MARRYTSAGGRYAPKPGSYKGPVVLHIPSPAFAGGVKQGRSDGAMVRELSGTRRSFQAAKLVHVRAGRSASPGSSDAMRRIQAEARGYLHGYGQARGLWTESKHPRGADGRFI